LLPARATEPVGLLLLLKAFSAGCSALTGVEAFANGVPLFKPPRVRRAKRTELLLGVILGAMLLGVATLAGRWRVAPSSSQTVLSQVVGRCPTGCVTGSCTTTSTWSSPGSCGTGRTSSSPASRCGCTSTAATSPGDARDHEMAKRWGKPVELNRRRRICVPFWSRNSAMPR
jgi:hypothetical protein